MDIVRVLICFQWLHLIVGLSVDHCVKLGYAEYLQLGVKIDEDEYKCLFKMSSTYRQLGVQCSKYRLQMQVLDHNSENPSDENDIPSLQRLWDTCMHSHKETTIKNDPSKYYFNVDLNHGIKQLPDNYFCNGPSIYAISISNTLLNDTRKLGFSSLNKCDSLCGPGLRRLHTGYNVFKKVFNSSFCGLDHLTTLDLANNKIKELESDAFINLKSLKNLRLDFNSISGLPPGVFREQQNTLWYLHLFNNQLYGQSILELKNLKQLRVLSLSYNRIDVLPKDVFKHMTQLTNLRLGSNSLKTLQGSLTTLINLVELSVSKNHISVIHPEDFQNMVKLSIVDFSFNPITNIDPEFCANCTKISNVQFNNASLTSVPKFISNSAQLNTVDLSNNRIGRIDVGAFDAGKYIDLIKLSFNQLTNITNAFTNCTVKQLILNHNTLTTFSFRDFSNRLINLDITHNNIHTIDTSHDIIPHTLFSLKTLNLSNNNLNEIADGSFDHVIMLRILHLDHNSLRYISENIFKRLNSLTQLFLSHNQLQAVEPNAFPLELQTLHLDNNQLTNFNCWQLDHLGYLTTLRLHGNTWSCDLSERLEEWLLNNSRIVEDICQIVCEQPNGTLHRVSQLSHCPEITTTEIAEVNHANEIDYAQLVVHANVWPWLLGLCACLVIALVVVICVYKRGAGRGSSLSTQSVAELLSEMKSKITNAFDN